MRRSPAPIGRAKRPSETLNATGTHIPCMFKHIARLFSKPATSPTPKAPGLVPFELPTAERIRALHEPAFETGYWAWRNRHDANGPRLCGNAIATRRWRG